MLFASLVFEKEPLQWRQFPELLVLWLQNAGAVSAAGVFLVLLTRMLQRDAIDRDLWKMPRSLAFIYDFLPYIIGICGICYTVVIVCWFGDWLGIRGAQAFLPRANPDGPLTIGDWILTVSGGLALFVAVTPIIVDIFTRMSAGRIWAIARLSWKEAIRGRIVWVFASMALIFLFADWFVSYKPEDQVRTYVRVVYWSMTPLFLITALLLGSFSIPTDVYNNSIHTIVTKPVEKFEIVLGRFLGYAGLLTLGLVAVSLLSLIYVVRGVNKEAENESYKARVVAYGRLHFAGTKNADRAESVGREWGHRSYISGPTRRQREAFRQYAIWDFADVPSNLGTRAEDFRFEYAFDIFRLSKGEEGKGVFVTFTFAEGDRQADELDNLADQIKQDRDKLEQDARKDFEKALALAGDEQGRRAAQKAYQESLNKIDHELLTKHRLYQAKGQEVSDYHTLHFKVPSKVFAVLLENHAAKKAAAGGTPIPPLRVFLSVDVSNEQQMLGVARQDFYLLSSDGWFPFNFVKGTVGLWCVTMMVLGITIACSTYLTSVIAFLVTVFLWGAGICGDYLKEVAERRVDGGGPMQSLIRNVTNMPVGGRLEENAPSTTVVLGIDNIFSWWIGRIINLFPDVNRHDLHQYVANGFDIGLINVLLLDNVLPLVGYLLPWAVLAYYLMKSREIANPQ